MPRFRLLVAILVAIAALGLAPSASAHYNPTKGRWLERDPIKYRGGPNLYAAMDASPVQRSDPSGLKTAAEITWCARNPCCCFNAQHSGNLVLEALERRYGSKIQDNTVENAVTHCAWMCYVASLWSCSQQQALELGTAHEEYPDNPMRDRDMDLFNNEAGALITGYFNTLESCIEGCELLAKQYRLYWWKAVEGRSPGRGLPDDYPDWADDGPLGKGAPHPWGYEPVSGLADG